MLNGHRRTAITYRRVSGDEQAHKGFSLDDQRDALREWCERNNYGVLEEIEDAGWSGADLQRPGLDRLRNLVSQGAASAVVVLSRDRLARGVQASLLAEEFREHGCRLVCLNTPTADDSPESTLQGGLLDLFAAYERDLIRRRLRRGLEEKVKQGKVICTGRAPYGYRLTEDDRLEIFEPEMNVVRRLYRDAAAGETVYALCQQLNAEDVPSPTGRAAWSKATIRLIINSGLYEPHPFQEVAELVASELAATLDKDGTYGLWSWGKKHQKTRKERGKDGVYRIRYSYETRPREALLFVPVPDAGIDRATVEAARRNVKSRARKPSGAARRFWELSGGIARCAECGSVLSPHTVISGDGYRRENHYYSCRSRYNDTAKSCNNRHSNRAAELEEDVWERVRVLLDDEAEIRRTFDEYAAWFRRSASAENERRLIKALERLDRKRSAYQEQHAEGLMTLADLKDRLKGTDEQHKSLRRELEVIAGDTQIATGIERMRDLLIEGVRAGRWRHRYGPEQRHELYRKMELTVQVDAEGNITLEGMLLASGAGFVGQENTPPPASRRTSPPPR